MQDSNTSQWRARLAWLVILSLTAFIVYRNARAVQSAEGDAISIDNLQLRVMAQEIVGFQSVASMFGPTEPAILAQSKSRMIGQMDGLAKSPVDRLHIAIIAGEVLGKDQALQRFDAVVQDHPSGAVAGDIAELRRIYTESSSSLDAAAQSRLIQRHDFFARVALSYGVAPNMEPRKSVEASGLHATMMMGLAVLVILVVLAAGIGLFIAAIVLQLKGRLTRAYVADPAATTAYLEGFAIYFVLFIPGLGLLRRHFGWADLQWEWLALGILPIVMSWISWRGAPPAEQRKALGWHTGKGVLREIGAGFCGYFAGTAVLAAGFLVTYFLMRQTGVTPQHPLIHMLEGNRWHVLGLYALVSVFAPIMEETMFRGALFHHLRRKWGWAVSAPIVAVIFAVIHPQGWMAVPVLGSIALVLAALREWRGSLIAPMVAHACNNFIVLTLALAILR